MKKSFLIIRANIQKAKGQTIAMILLILLAAMMLNLWLMLSTDYKENFRRTHEQLHDSHVTLMVCSREEGVTKLLKERLLEDARTKQICMTPVLWATAAIPYNDGVASCESFFLPKDTALGREVGRIEILEESSGSGVYLPMLYGGDNHRVGDTITFSFGGEELSLVVRGYFNSPMAGSHNCAVTAFVVTEDVYQELSQKPYMYPSTLASVRIADEAHSQEYEAMAKNVISVDYPDVRAISNSYTMVTQSRYISQSTCSGIISAMAFFILLIALVVIASNVSNYIRENMKNLGALKAVGYTGRQLVGILLGQFVGIALVTASAGTGLSYLLFPAVNEMMIAQTGIPYQLRFLPLPCLVTLGLTGASVGLAVWLSARRIKRIEPITALRQGIRTHSFKRNHLPLEKTHGPLNLSLGMKATCAGLWQNVTVCITMLVLSLVIAFSGLMWRNMMVDIKPFTDLIVGETADSCLNVNSAREQEFLTALEKNDCVEKVYLYHSVELRHVGGLALTANLSDDFSKVNNPGVVFEGRCPKYDNEIAIAAKYAREQGLAIGDEIVMTAGGQEAVYLITGFTQISNHLGKDCLLTRSGYQRLGELPNVSYYINVKPEIDVDVFNEDMTKQFPGEINAAFNIQTVMDGTSAVYVSMMRTIVVAVLILSVCIVAFVLYLLVRTMLNSKKRDYGIMKALGFTTGQLVCQTALSFMPAMVLSLAVGLTVSALSINSLTALFLREIGIVKCNFLVPTGFIAIAGICLALVAFGLACLLSMKIRKIAPRVLLTEGGV